MKTNTAVVASISLAIFANLTITAYNAYQLNGLQKDSSSSISELIKSSHETKLFETNQSGMIELASNNRMATIIAYQVKNGATLDSLIKQGYLEALSTTFKQDFIDDNVYARLAAFGTNAEYVVNSSTSRLIRNKWEAKIAPGSHFDQRPQGRLLLPSESVSIPQCNKDFMPYIAYVVASPLTQLNTEADVDITEENGLTPQYRFILKINGNPAPFNTDYRILADVGCSPIPTEDKKEKLSN